MNAPASFPLSAPQPSRMLFSGGRGDFLKMLIKGSLLQIPTFGFYRFWLNTKIRRHLWANTHIEGEAFEYTGTAKELLIGFLIALAVLAPLYLVYFILAFMLEEQQAFASLPLALVMYVLAHFGSYRARRYRATRTIFRGIRFWMKGSGWAYAFRAILWDFAMVLTLGLALPWAMASLERYRMRHTYFGTLQGEFAGTGWELFKRGIWVWILGVVLVFGLPIIVGLTMAYGVSGKPENISFLFDSDKALELAASLLPMLVILVALALMPLAMAIFTRWQIDGLRFGEVAVTSKLRARTIYGLLFKLIFTCIGVLLAFGLAFGIAGGVDAVFFGGSWNNIDTTSSSAQIIIGLLITIAFFVYVLGFGVIKRYFFGRGLWAAIVTTTSVTNLPALDAAIAAGQPSGVLGEGLADALDFNAGI
jgi:uncharacterized membrane protein YjgN (DUF898 family)